MPKICSDHKETPWNFFKCIWNTKQFNYLLHIYLEDSNRCLTSLILLSNSGQNNLLYSSRLTPLDYTDIIAVCSWKHPCNFNLPHKYTQDTNYKQASSKILFGVFYWLNCDKLHTQVVRLPYREKCYKLYNIHTYYIKTGFKVQIRLNKSKRSKLDYTKYLEMQKQS